MSFECNAIGMKDVNVGDQLTTFRIKRRPVGDGDVHLELLASSVCHSDLHYIQQHWMPLQGTVVPGHEMIGKVIAVGKNVKNVAVGSIQGVGCMVGANCINKENNEFTCRMCKDKKIEMYCEKGHIGTYIAKELVDDVEQWTYGGYSTDIVVNSNFCVSIPEYFHDKLAATTPILCAGITSYSSLVRANVKAGSKVGIAGLGGLGWFAAKLAMAMGAEVYAISRSEHKIDELKAMGVKDVIISTNPENFIPYTAQLDCIVDTISAKHDLTQLLGLLVPFGALAIVGGAPEPLDLNTLAIIMGSKQIFGSMIGSIAETQEVINLCAEHQILIPVEVIQPQEINEAFKRLLKSDVKYRFAIDMETLRNMTVDQ